MGRPNSKTLKGAKLYMLWNVKLTEHARGKEDMREDTKTFIPQKISKQKH